MTKITFYSTDGYYSGFLISGHSGYGEDGDDIVCAGISALTINFINSVEKFTDDKVTVATDEEEGIIRFEFSGKPSKESRLLTKSLVMGLSDLQKDYKDFILLDYKEV